MPLTGKTITQLPYVNYTALTDNDLLIVENFQVVTGITKSTTITDLKDYVFSGFSDVFVTGGTYSNGDVIFTNNTGGTFSVSGFYTGATDSYITGGTYSNGVTTLTDSTGGTITISGYYTGATDVFVTGGTYLNGDVTFTNNTGGTFNVSGFYTGATDVFVTGGTYSNGDVTFTNNTGGTFNVNGFYTGATDVFVTGGTYLDGTTTFTNNTGGTFNVTGYYTGTTDVFVTGGTYSNGDITFTNNTGGTFNVNGLYTGATDVFVTGGTYSNGSAIFTNNTGGTFNVDGFYTGATDVFVTGGTFDKNTSTLTFTNNTGDTFNVTGLTDVYVSGMTFNTGNYNLTIDRNDGVSFTESLSILGSDLRVTGGTYDPITGNGTFTNNTGGTFVVTGFLVGYTDLYVSGGTYSNGTATFTNTSGGTFTVPGFYTGATDVFVTGGTYSNGDILFTNNTGGTFNVTGLYTGATDVFVTGGTYDNLTGDAIFTNNTGGTFTVTGFTTGNTDTNFANTNLIFDGDRTHLTNGNYLYIADSLIPTSSYLYLDENINTVEMGLGVYGIIRFLPTETFLSGPGLAQVYFYSGETVFNASGYDVDFRVVSDTNPNMLVVDGGTDRVGIGLSSPTETLDVSGKTKTINFQMTDGSVNGYVLTSDANGNASWQQPNVGLSISGGTVTGNTIFTQGLTATTFSATTYQNYPTQDLSTTLGYGDSSGVYDISMGTGTSIVSDNVGSRIDMDFLGGPGNFRVTTDDGVGNESILELSPVGANIGTQTNTLSFSNSATIFNVDDIFNVNAKYLSTLVTDTILIQDNATSAITTSTGFKPGIIIGSELSTINSGIKNVVIAGGDNITATTNNTLYSDNFNIFSTPINNNSNTQILSRNASTGNIQYTSLSYITGLTSNDTFVTGGTYNNQTGNATFTNNTGGTFNVTGFFTGDSTQYLALSGGTVTGNTTFTQSLTGNTIFVSGETASRILSTDASKKITSLDTATYPSLTELSYVKGVTSSIQTQLNGFVPTTRLINTTLPLSGGGNLTIDRTLTIMDAQADGSTKGAAAFTASDFNATSGIISIDYTNGQSSSSVNKGFLTSTDWNTFNNKVSTGRTINTTAPLLGGGNLSSDRTLSISDAVADGINKGAATFTPSDFNSSSGVISIDYANAQAASSVNKGFLTSADWTTFNDKTKEIYNYNTTGQTIGALAAHIVGTKLPLTNVKEGTTVTWKISVTKTAAGNAAPIWSVKVGSTGNNTDTTFLTITSPPQTNTADTGYITIECIFRSGINTNSVLVSHLNLSHNSGTNGLANVFSWDGWAQSSSNPFINPNHFISLSVAPGILSSWTINQVSATMTNTQ